MLGAITILQLILSACLHGGATGSIPHDHFSRRLVSALPVDVDPPRFVAAVGCGSDRPRYVVVDSGAGNEGIGSVRLDESASSNVLLNEETPLTPGAATHAVRLRLIDTTLDGEATLIAVDQAGNADTLVVPMGINLPTLSDTALFYELVRRSERRTLTLRLTNRSGRLPIRIDSVRTTPGSLFRIDGAPEGAVIAPGETYDLDISFLSTFRRDAIDSAVIVIDCRRYVVRLRATMTAPRITVENIDFWQVIIGREVCATMRVDNVGGDTMTIRTIEVAGSDYRFDTADYPELPLHIGPGDTASIPICFTPRRLGLLLGTVTVISSAADTVSAVAQLVGIGVNSLTSTAFDDEGRELQISVVPQGTSLTVVSADRGRALNTFSLFTIKGEEVQLAEVDRIGEGWWHVTLERPLMSGMYFLRAVEPDVRPITVKFVVL